MPEHKVFRDGKVHILSEKCATCIFHQGNRMHLEQGRVKGMVEECLSDEGGNIPCHKTIFEDGAKPAICRGFWDAYHDRIPLLQIAERMDIVVEEEPPCP